MTNQFENIFVSLEVAKLAKEKGFNEWCCSYYHGEQKHLNPHTFEDNYDIENSLFSNFQYQAPTHYQLIEWLSGKGFRLCKPYTKWLMYDSKFNKLIETFEDINQALIKALNLIK